MSLLPRVFIIIVFIHIFKHLTQLICQLTKLLIRYRWLAFWWNMLTDLSGADRSVEWRGSAHTKYLIRTFQSRTRSLWTFITFASESSWPRNSRTFSFGNGFGCFDRTSKTYPMNCSQLWPSIPRQICLTFCRVSWGRRQAELVVKYPRDMAKKKGLQWTTKFAGEPDRL